MRELCDNQSSLDACRNFAVMGPWAVLNHHHIPSLAQQLAHHGRDQVVEDLPPNLTSLRVELSG